MAARTTQTTAPQTAAQQAEAGNGAAASWSPSRYGAGDQAGALNEITPSKVLEAVRLVGQGRVFDLAHVLHESIPAFPGRTFRQYLTTNSQISGGVLIPGLKALEQRFGPAA